MLRLTICLLMAKTAFAANAYPKSGFVPVGPDTNLVFNFQQIRRDQPSQVEMREENIHKYMNRPRTTTPLPIDNGDMSPMRPVHPRIPIPYTEEQWNALQTAPKYDGPVENWKNVPASPNFPHWNSLAVNNKYNGYESEPLVATDESGQWHEPLVATDESGEWHEPPVVTDESGQWHEPLVVTEDSGQWHGPGMHSRAAPVPSYIPQAAPTTFAPYREPVRHSSRNPSRGRGHHRFNWNEGTMESPTTMPSVAPTAAPTRMPPPPVPTLSPWLDGF